MNDIKIAILDDEQEILSSLLVILENEGFMVDAFLNSKTFFDKLIKINYHILFLDINLGKQSENGIDILRKIKNMNIEIKIVVISGSANIKIAIEAIKLGAKDFLEKPLHLQEVLKCLNSIVTNINIKSERNQLLHDLLSQYEILGESKEISKVRDKIMQYAPLKEAVLITGKSGVGKELVAANLHYLSNRRSKNYIKVNIASLSESILDSQLFGYVKGAFSGALTDTDGLFWEANNSTLFLDEIAELKIDLQAKLLRVIQEKEFFPVGSTKTQKINTRLIFATNKNLQHEISKGNFREDLYYRISTLSIEVPSLKERKEDIPIIAKKFICDFCIQNNIPIKELSDSSINKLQEYDFPGNVRQLRNIVIRSIINSQNSQYILPENLIFNINDSTKTNKENIFNQTMFLHEKKKELEKKYIEFQLKKFNFDIKETAIALGILPNNLYRKIKEFKISKDKANFFL